jgi:peptide methionine sulfoxide reductase MsrB
MNAEDGSKKDVRPSHGSRPKSFVKGRNMFDVDGHSLENWDKDNFEPKRDATCRIVYEPKNGEKFFRETLDHEDYDIMRCHSTSLEQPYFSKYNRFFPQMGHFCCKACGNLLYSYETKFDVDDGWPAFGACILGSIGIIPAEERQAQIEKEDLACIKIQAYVRGNICRIRVSEMLDGLIQELMKKKDKDSSRKTENDSCTSDEDSFANETKKTNGRLKGTGYILSRALGENYAEIHCHRCKSHLGDVFAEENTGNNGEEYREHHRVNGRSLKFMHQNLPKRTMTGASLLFADQSQRKRFGLPDAKQKDEAKLPFRRVLLRNTSNPLSVSEHQSSYQRSIPRKSSDPLSVSQHESAYQSKTRYKASDPSNSFQKGRGKQSNLLSVSMHESPRNMPSTIMERHLASPGRKNKSVDPLGSYSCHERIVSPKKINTGSRRRPMRRGNTNSLINIKERKAFLEISLQHSFH